MKQQPPDNWKELLEHLTGERDRLQREVGRLRMEREELFRGLAAMLGDQPEVNAEEILAQMGKEKPLREFLQELRAELVKD